MVSKVAIAGVTSKLGRLIAQELLKEPSICLRGSTRNAENVPSQLQGSDCLEIVQTGPYDREKLRSLISGCDVVICCYLADNDTMWEGQKLLVDVCEQEGVPRYIASDYTADYTKLDYGTFVRNLVCLKDNCAAI